MTSTDLERIIVKALERYRNRMEEVGGLDWYSDRSVTQNEIARVNEILAMRLVIANAPAMLEVLQLVYRKHCTDDDSIGWEELGDKVADVLSNAMYIDEFLKWQNEHSEQP